MTASRTKLDRAVSPFVDRAAPPLPPAKFRDPSVTADGLPRAQVTLEALETLWLNTGTLCNLACANCYIESTPRNDALVYLSAAEASAFLDEIARLGLKTQTIGFTGGEPFMNPDIVAMLADALDRGHSVLVLTNAMRPMRRHEVALRDLQRRHGRRLEIRVSLDHHTQEVHEAERGADSWAPACEGVAWLAENDFRVAIAGRRLPGETDVAARRGYARLLDGLAVCIDVDDPARLVLFPEMDPEADIPEITESCWGILGIAPRSVMCATSRMIVKRKGAARPHVVACTLVPYDLGFDLGPTLADASYRVALNHPNCARFCVLGGASCS